MENQKNDKKKKIKDNNELLGATWFVPTLFFSTIYFGIIYKWFRREKLVYIYFFITLLGTSYRCICFI